MVMPLLKQQPAPTLLHVAGVTSSGLLKRLATTGLMLLTNILNFFRLLNNVWMYEEGAEPNLELTHSPSCLTKAV